MVLQRVLSARVEVDRETVAAIGSGLLVLVAVEKGDGDVQAARAADRIAGLRIFEDTDGKMNLAPSQVGAQVLVVSQFTLAANVDRGRRPSFERAAAPEVAAPLVEALVTALQKLGIQTRSGRFGARMAVELVNDGPVTFVLDCR